MEERIAALLGQLTLEEKIALTTGGGVFATQAVERLGIPAICLSDGPHGVRKIRPGSLDPLEPAYPATCFPTASALAATWDPELVRQVGEAIGQECLALDVQVLLGPGVNLKRTPLCGRNFEYYSEDPVLAGEIGAAFVQGVQSKGVGTSLKHFACNNQEYERMTISAEVDERTLREIYLAAFERVVKKAQPWTVMSAYNQVGGTPASEHPELLNGILKGEWGCGGLIVSDWGAVSHRDRALEAGLDLEMPAAGEIANARLLAAVRDGKLSGAALDRAAAQVLRLVEKGLAGRCEGAEFDVDAHHALARRVAAEAMVLLKNDGDLLPLDPARLGSLAVIGRFAKEPRMQGEGSAHVNPTRFDTAWDELERLLAGTVTLRYAADGEEAIAAAAASDVAVVFAGLPDEYESESYDRTHLELPPEQIQQIADVCRVQPRTVVVLVNGSAVTMDWLGGPAAVVEAWLGGQAAGGAMADLLLGRVNPSGKLAETFPVRLADTPAYLNYPGEEGRVRYGEGIFIGYRYYDRVQRKPLFPFGYGLSYTTFAFTGIALDRVRMSDTEEVAVTVNVRNTGRRAGKEVVQLYVRDVESEVIRPVKELKAFAKVALEPGEEKQVRLTLTGRDFASWSASRHAWVVESGEFELLVGPSSAETPLRASVTVTSEAAPLRFEPMTPFKRFLANPVAERILLGALEQKLGISSIAPEYLKWVRDMPLVKVAHLVSGGMVSEADVEEIVQQVNAALQ